MKRHILVFVASVALIMVGLVGVTHASEGNQNECPETITKVIEEAWTETVVDEEAWTEVIEHAAITKEVHHPAIPAVTKTIPAVPGVWANWSPNDTKGPQDYVPVWPQDDRGTWHLHKKLPPGHEGPDGVYQKGGGNSPWFYREAGTPERVEVIKPEVPAWTETVTIKEAWTEKIDHPAKTHEVDHPVVTEEVANPDFPCDEPTSKPTPKEPPPVTGTHGVPPRDLTTHNEPEKSAKTPEVQSTPEVQNTPKVSESTQEIPTSVPAGK